MVLDEGAAQVGPAHQLEELKDMIRQLCVLRMDNLPYFTKLVESMSNRNQEVIERDENVTNN